MFDRKPSAYALPFWYNGRALTGLLYFASGVVVASCGVLRIWDLWTQLESYLPFSIPPDIPERIASNIPDILSRVVNAVASLAGLLLGIAWLVSGVPALIAFRRYGMVPGSLRDPEIVAAAMVRFSNHAAENPSPQNFTSSMPVNPYRISKVSKRIFYELCWSILKLLLIVAAVKLLLAVVTYLPRFIHETTKTQVVVMVPSGSELYFLVGLFIAADVIMALSLFARIKKPLAPNMRIMEARGSAHPALLLALFEESVILGSPDRVLSHARWRLTKVDETPCFGSLVEIVHGVSIPWQRPAVYSAMLFSVLATATGFYSLMNVEFTGSFSSVGQLASEQGLVGLFRVLFLIGLVILGGHLTRWVEIFVRWTGWESTLFLVTVCPGNNRGQDETAAQQNLPSPLFGKSSSWNLQTSPDHKALNALVNKTQLLHVNFFWAHAYSESSTPSAQRNLAGAGSEVSLDEYVERIIESPFMAHFELDKP